MSFTALIIIRKITDISMAFLSDRYYHSCLSKYYQNKTKKNKVEENMRNHSNDNVLILKLQCVSKVLLKSLIRIKFTMNVTLKTILLVVY